MPTGLLYKPEDHEDFVGRLHAGPSIATSSFGPPGWAWKRAARSSSSGCLAAGTTLAEQILASHPRVHGAGERLFGRQVVREGAVRRGGRRLPRRSAPPRWTNTRSAARRGASRQAERPGSGPVGSHRRQAPGQLPLRGTARGDVPRTPPSSIPRRDLRNVAVSCWLSDFRSIRWANDPSHIARRLGQYVRLMEHWRGGVRREPLIEVDYEDTVADLEGVARRLVAGCGLAWDPSCLEFHRTRRCRADGQPQPGPPAGLQGFRRPLEEL